MASSQRDPSRRQFIRNLAAGSAAVASVTIGYSASVLGDTQPIPDSAAELLNLQRWVAAGRDWQLLRENFLLDPQISYLNTGSVGACPSMVVAAHARYLHEIERSPTQMVFGEGGSQMEEVRTLAANFLGASLDEVMLTANTTTGMNMVADALPLKAGDEVLTTNHEHPGGQVCWEHQRSRRGVAIREVNLDQPFGSAAEVVRAVTSALTERTRVISLSHVSTINGLRLPIAAISQVARQRGYLRDR